jgi:hypothetical protein
MWRGASRRRDQAAAAPVRPPVIVVEAPRGGLRTMNILKDSSFYPVLLKEGKEIGHIEQATKIIIRLGRIRFGRLPRATRAALEAINDLNRLEKLAVRMLTATSWDDLLAGRKQRNSSSKSDTRKTRTTVT